MIRIRHLSVGRMLRSTTSSGGLWRPDSCVAFNRRLVSVLDGSEMGDYPGFAGGDGLPVTAAVGPFGQGLTVGLDFTGMGFAFVSVAATVTGMLAWAFGMVVTPLVAKLANSGHHLTQVL